MIKANCKNSFPVMLTNADDHHTLDNRITKCKLFIPELTQNKSISFNYGTKCPSI